ncbi:MAG: phage holin family protein [Mollicutes bacterium]|nr:phage holin family protein [Mollicutes bacterium]MDY5875460.1 phage holin family protein [Bacilli bacterium]
MQVVINEKNKLRLNKFLDWLLYFIGYTIVFILVTTLFKSIHIDKNHFILWSTIIVFIVYLLNKTIKPVLVTLTIPITGITLGLFYPCINVFLLKLTDWILGPHFQITNLFVAIFAAVLLSITNFIMEEIIKTIINKVKTHE